MDAILRNPYHFCGAIIARLAVCGATLLWSLIVLIRPGALTPTSYGAAMTDRLPEDAYGWFFLALSVTLIWRIFAKARPHWCGIVAYGLLMLSWGWVDAMLWLARPMQPTSTSWVTIGTALAVYAFVANRRPRCDHVSGDR